jgi:hypothetical protein
MVEQLEKVEGCRNMDATIKPVKGSRARLDSRRRRKAVTNTRKKKYCKKYRTNWAAVESAVAAPDRTENQRWSR